MADHKDSDRLGVLEKTCTFMRKEYTKEIDKLKDKMDVSINHIKGRIEAVDSIIDKNVERLNILEQVYNRVQPETKKDNLVDSKLVEDIEKAISQCRVTIIKTNGHRIPDCGIWCMTLDKVVCFEIKDVYFTLPLVDILSIEFPEPKKDEPKKESMASRCYRAWKQNLKINLITKDDNYKRFQILKIMPKGGVVSGSNDDFSSIIIPFGIITDVQILMSEKDALQETKSLWIEMRDNNCKSWADKKRFLDQYYHSDCPCCEYVKQNHPDVKEWGYYDNDCIQYCPLKSLWPKGCVFKDSVYYPFTNSEGNAEAAQKIIDACDKKLINKLKRCMSRVNLYLYNGQQHINAKVSCYYQDKDVFEFNNNDGYKFWIPSEKIESFKIN